jgi:hypothetical protein
LAFLIPHNQKPSIYCHALSEVRNRFGPGSVNVISRLVRLAARRHTEMTLL